MPVVPRAVAQPGPRPPPPAPAAVPAVGSARDGRGRRRLGAPLRGGGRAVPVHGEPGAVGARVGAPSEVEPEAARGV